MYILRMQISSFTNIVFRTRIVIKGFAIFFSILVWLSWPNSANPQSAIRNPVFRSLWMSPRKQA